MKPKSICYRLEDWHGDEAKNPGEPWEVKIEPLDDVVIVTFQCGEESVLMWGCVIDGRPQFRVASEDCASAIIVHNPDRETFEVSSDITDATLMAQYRYSTWRP